MKIRPASSFLLYTEAMEHVQEVASWSELMALLRQCFPFWNPTDETVTITPHGGLDERNGWDTHVICVRGNAALFCDGKMEYPK